MMKRSPAPAVLLILLAMLPSVVAAAQVLHVGPTGLKLDEAFRQAAESASVSIIELADGEYHTAGLRISAPKDGNAAALPILTIRAAAGASPRITTAVRLTEAQAVADKPGLYRAKIVPRQEEHVWEADTRTRYVRLFTRASVAAIPGSCFLDREEGALYVHTTTGKPPQEHQVFVDTSAAPTIRIDRPNTTLEGIAFVGNHSSATIDVRADNVAVRNCRFEMCVLGWQPFTAVKNAVLEDCVGEDVAQPVYSFADQCVVRGCRFEKKRDGYLYELYPQNDSAYQVYAPGAGGTIEGNFARGYHNGVWIKAGSGRYLVRHNTLVDCHTGIMWVTSSSNSDASHNVIVNAAEYVIVAHFDDTFTCDANLYWGAEQADGLVSWMDRHAGANRGRRTMYADPLFVNPDKGDYRVLPTSPALWLKDEQGAPAGAFAAAPVETAARTAPSLTLHFQSDSRPFGEHGSLDFVGDPWNGTPTTHIRDLRPEGQPPMRMVGQPRIVVEPRASDRVGSIVSLRYRVDDGVPVIVDWKPVWTLDLPDADGTYTVTCEVINDRGVWSSPATFIVRSDQQPPAFVGDPQIATTDHGVIVAVQAGEPCTARLLYGHSASDLSHVVELPKVITRSWDANDGGDWRQTWTTPRQQLVLGVSRPDIESGQTLFFKVELTDEAGLVTTSDVHQAVIRGPVRTLRVAADGRGEFSSLQDAVDRALPGDRIILAPGVYSRGAFVHRGGADDNTRLIIEAEQPGTVIIDVAKRDNSVIHVEDASYVTIRNLTMLSFNKTAVLAYRSPHVTVERCETFKGWGWLAGYHVFAMYSPHCTVTRCLAVGAESGFYFIESPFATVTHNTASQQMYAATGYTFAVRGLVQMYNSFAFSGNSITELLARNPEDLKTIRIDYNNYACDVAGYEPNSRLKQSDPALWQQIVDERVTGSYPPGFRTVSKQVSTMHGKRAMTMQQWRELSGQDQRSIFVDPQYVNPLAPADRWNWRVRESSPNRIKHSDAKVIGAFE